MTTLTIRKPAKFPWFLLAVFLFILLILSLPQLSQHAIKNHGANAYSVTQRFKQPLDPDDNDVWQAVCPDGRRYTIRQLPGGKAWDVSVDTVNGYNITRWTCTSRTWIARKLAWCQ